MAGHLPAGGNSTHALEIGAGEDLDHAWHGFGVAGVDLADLAVGHLAADEMGVKLAPDVDIVGVTALSGQEPYVFAPLGAGADADMAESFNGKIARTQVQ